MSWLSTFLLFIVFNINDIALNSTQLSLGHGRCFNLMPSAPGAPTFAVAISSEEPSASWYDITHLYRWHLISTCVPALMFLNMSS